MKTRALTVLIVALVATSTEIACGGDTDSGNKSLDVTGAGGTDAATGTGGNTVQTGGNGGTVATGGTVTVATGGAVASGGTTHSGGIGGMATGGTATTGGTGGATGGSNGDGGSGGATGGTGPIDIEGGAQFVCDTTADPSLGCDECAQVRCCAEWEDCVSDPTAACLNADNSGEMTCVIACTDAIYASNGSVTQQDVATCAGNCGDGGGLIGANADALITCLLAIPADAGAEPNCALECFSVF